MLYRARRSPIPRRQVLALGLLQGPTELLPVSSSAHAALLPSLAGWSYARLDPELRKSFEVALHAGAGLALALQMRGELARGVRETDARRAVMIVCSLAPPALAGLALRGPIQRRLGGGTTIAACLLAGAAAMVLADCNGRADRRFEEAGPLDGLALGVAQAAALVPGVSRSGATLTAARLRGFSRADAQDLSWHAAMPVMLGASALELRRLARPGAGAGQARALVGGATAAFLSTLASARLLRRTPRRGTLLAAAAYRAGLAMVVLRRLRGAHNKSR